MKYFLIKLIILNFIENFHLSTLLKKAFKNQKTENNIHINNKNIIYIKVYSKYEETTNITYILIKLTLTITI